jgi:hypothetical protein
MARAIKARDLKDSREQALPQDAQDKHARKRARIRALRNKNFEQLNPPEKDLLLKAVAVKLGLIQDSEDA